jgi:16S rRNA (guanine1207-N2)-methyltransferase
MHKQRNAEEAVFPAAWIPVLQSKMRPPVCVVLGSPRQVVELVQATGLEQPVLYQMDVYQAQRLRQRLDEHHLSATVATHADLWDCGGDFQTVIFLVEPRGERILKLDMIEQAFHILRPHGTAIVLSRHDRDRFFPPALKKIFGKVHTPQTGEATLLWCQRDGERPRRRHEVTFQISGGEGPSLRFLSRPGVFSYGRFDNGARALMETAVINPGDRILDLGCGCGTNGIIAGVRAGPTGHVTFVDSNCRAAVLTQVNAAANGLTNFDVKTSSHLDEWTPHSFDVILANPPYFAGLSIAQRFIEQACPLLKPGGRLFLVTKQPSEVGPLIVEHFGPTEAVERRGYIIMCALASKNADGSKSCLPQRS